MSGLILQGLVSLLVLTVMGQLMSWSRISLSLKDLEFPAAVSSQNTTKSRPLSHFQLNLLTFSAFLALFCIPVDTDYFTGCSDVYPPEARKKVFPGLGFPGNNTDVAFRLRNYVANLSARHIIPPAHLTRIANHCRHQETFHWIDDKCPG